MQKKDWMGQPGPGAKTFYQHPVPRGIHPLCDPNQLCMSDVDSYDGWESDSDAAPAQCLLCATALPGPEALRHMAASHGLDLSAVMRHRGQCATKRLLLCLVLVSERGC